MKKMATFVFYFMNFTFLQPLANVMKIDVSPSNKLWKDRVNLELGIAVCHSFRKASCVIIDQHSLVSNGPMGTEVFHNK